MSLLKAEAKLSAVNELGCRLDDVLETANQDLYRAEGATSALRQAVSSIENLLKVLDKELDEKETDLEVSKMIKGYVDRARINLMNLVTSSEGNRQSQIGKIQGFQHAVSIAKKFKDEELNKLQVLRNAIDVSSHSIDASKEETKETSEKSGRPAGTRPAPPIKLQRLTEEASTIVNPEEKVEEKTRTKKQKK